MRNGQIPTLISQGETACDRDADAFDAFRARSCAGGSLPSSTPARKRFHVHVAARAGCRKFPSLRLRRWRRRPGWHAQFAQVRIDTRRSSQRKAVLAFAAQFVARWLDISLGGRQLPLPGIEGAGTGGGVRSPCRRDSVAVGLPTLSRLRARFAPGAHTLPTLAVVHPRFVVSRGS